MDAPRIELDRLLENARWVRALGVELVGAGEADDLAQDAWVVALEEQRGVRNPAAWLAGVVRHLAGRARRSAERRTRREQAVARPEAGPPTPEIVELVAEAELSRALIRAVTELDEPFRATVLLRFYRGWTPEEIARSQGVPAATVRTRLHRALARLRERFDREHGGREAWALAFAGPGMAAASPLAAGTFTGGVAMGPKAWVGGALALAVVAGYWLRPGRDEATTGSSRDGVAAAGVAPAEAQLPPEPALDPAGARREAAPAAEPAAAFAEVLLYGSVTDPSGAAVELESLGLEDARGVVRSVSRPAAGSFALAGLAPGRHVLRARAKGFLSARESLVLRADAEHQRHDLVLAPGLAIPVKIVDETGARWKEDAEDPRKATFELVVTPGAPPGTLGGLQRNVGFLYGCGELVSAGNDEVRGLSSEYFGLLRLRAPTPLFASLVLRDATLATRRIDGPMDELVFSLDRAQVRARLGGIAVRFVDALGGAPLHGGQAGLDPPSSFSYGGVQLDANGVARFEGLAPGLYTLRYFDPERAITNRRVRVPEGAVAELDDVPVWPRATIQGTVLDARGKPVTASVRWAPLAELRGPADLELGSSQRVPGGRFELEGVARGLVRVFASAPDHALFARTIDASSGLVQGLVLQLEEGQPVVLRAPEEWAGRQATLFDAAGVPLETWTLGSYTPRTRLEPGGYALGLGRAERVDGRHELVVADMPLELDLGALAR